MLHSQPVAELGSFSSTVRWFSGSPTGEASGGSSESSDGSSGGGATSRRPPSEDSQTASESPTAETARAAAAAAAGPAVSATAVAVAEANEILRVRGSSKSGFAVLSTQGIDNCRYGDQTGANGADSVWHIPNQHLPGTFAMQGSARISLRRSPMFGISVRHEYPFNSQ